MTDKQIIIDGVDVSECENLMQGIVLFGCMEDRKTCSCMNNPNCLYKQLKRKEQECNKYKQTLTEIKEIAEENFYFLDCYYRFILEKILQKISGCEVKR